MVEAETIGTFYGSDDAGKTRNEAALSSTPPYYWSWYRLIFFSNDSLRNDEQSASVREGQ